MLLLNITYWKKYVNKLVYMAKLDLRIKLLVKF